MYVHPMLEPKRLSDACAKLLRMARTQGERSGFEFARTPMHNPNQPSQPAIVTVAAPTLKLANAYKITKNSLFQFSSEMLR
jgi:hypothetical protein